MSNILTTVDLSAFIIERTAKRLKLMFSRELLEHPSIDITVDQWVILQILNKKGSMSQMEIADESLKDAPTVTRIIDILEQKSYVSRNPNPKDRRQYIIDLTASGKLTVQNTMPIVEKFRAHAYHGLDKAQLATLEKTMKKIESNLINKSDKS